MKKEEFEKKMENLETPEVIDPVHQRQLRLTLLNSKRSAIFGIVLIIAPFLFISGAVLKYNLGFDFKILSWFFDFITAIDSDSDSSVVSWMIRFMLMGFPMVAIVVNLLAILHFQYVGSSKEVLIAIKLKWANILIILFCASVFLGFLLYLIVENI